MPVERSIQGSGAAGRESPGDFKRAAVIGEGSVVRGPKQSRRHVAPAFAAARARRSVVEATIGYPAPLYRAIGHPVTWMGRWLAWLEAALNRADAGSATRRAAGVLALCLYLAPVALVAWAATRVCALRRRARFCLLALLAASLPAQRSLAVHVSAVADGLDASLDEGRRAVAKIVGRNPDVLDEAGVARAAIESLAENFSDGVVAPILWIALGGLVGGALYKAINTADSMIGHQNERYKAFGWAAARLDDLVNLPASRLAALWLILGALASTPGASARDAARAVWRDASRHRSPNAGWPEAAMAGALGLKLAGPRVYGETLVDDAFMGSGRREADAADIRRALRLFTRACAIQAGMLAVGGGLGCAGGDREGCGSEPVSSGFKGLRRHFRVAAPVLSGGLFAKACRAVGHEVCVERAAGYKIMRQTQ